MDNMDTHTLLGKIFLIEMETVGGRFSGGINMFNGNIVGNGYLY